MPLETVFIGTSHIDPDGFTNLIDALEFCRPELILLEVSRMSIILRKTYGFICRLVLNHNLKLINPEITPEIKNIKNFIGIPHEYMAARDYCRKYGVEYVLIDVSIISLARFFHAYKLVTKRNISIAADIHDDRFMQEKGIAACIMDKKDRLLLNMKLSQFRKDRLSMFREKLLLGRVGKYARRHIGRRIVYVGGWEHMLDDNESKLLYPAFTLPKKRMIAFMKGDKQ